MSVLTYAAVAAVVVVMAALVTSILELVAVRRRAPQVQSPRQHRQPRGERPHDGWLT